MRRWLVIALVLLLGIAALASQPWFAVKLTAGNELSIAGYDAYPNFGPTLLMDALAIALVLYLHRRWGVIFLVASMIATLLGAISQVPALFGGDLGILSPMVEKATGISSWVAQLEQVVLSHQSTFFGYGTWLLLAALLVVQALAIRDALKKAKPTIAKAKQKISSNRKTPSRATSPTNIREKPQDLWKETDPSNL